MTLNAEWPTGMRIEVESPSSAMKHLAGSSPIEKGSPLKRRRPNPGDSAGAEDIDARIQVMREVEWLVVAHCGDS